MALKGRTPKLVLVMALALIVVMVASIATPLAAAYTPRVSPSAKPQAKIAPELLKGSAYNAIVGDEKIDNAVVRLLSAAGARKVAGPSGLARIAVYYRGGDAALRVIEGKVYRVTSVMKTSGLSVAFALASKSQVEELAKLPFVVRIEEQKSLVNLLSERSWARMTGAPTTPLRAPQPEARPAGGGDPYLIYSAPDLLGARYVWKTYNISGYGVKIGIVDTGVDLGSPDLGDAKVAKAPDGTPLIFDADELGLTLLFPAAKVNSTAINVTPVYEGKYLLFFFNGNIYATNSTFAAALNFLTGKVATAQVPIVNVTYKIPSTSGNVTFGLAFQYVEVYYLDKGIPFYGVIEYTVPVAFADTNGDGTFDTVYPDLSTAYYLVMKVLNNITGGAIPEASESLVDYSFTDEPALDYPNHVVAARDFTGDGVPDFSAGALAGALYDYWGVFGPSTPYGLDWMSDWEPTAYVVPGVDTAHGRWVDFLYDFYGHGTSCAHVAAASGKTERYIESTAPGVNFTTTMPGIAPNASVGAAVALWNGDVITAELWLAGFDQVNATTYTWSYTGKHQVDVISNSWGSSWLLWNGYASDADPTSLWEDYITLVSGTVIVHAAGNGGPGFGSVTYPGAASFVITVGAATDFYYRPAYGIGNATYLPGGYGLVVSWSDRGPTEFGYPKPDVIDIGSFEWAGDRAIDAPYNGTYAYELFGGTSEATPMTAGAAALIIEALREANITPTPSLVKAILKSSAVDMGFDPFSQGSGFVNVSKAVEIIEEGGYIVYSYDSVLNVLENFDETMAAMLGVTPEDIITAVNRTISDTAVYPGVMLPGQEKNVTLYIEGIGASNVSANLSDYTLMKAGEIGLASLLNLSAARLVSAASNGSVISVNASSLFLGGSGDTVYVNISAIPAGSRIAIPLTGQAEQEILKGNLTVIHIAFPALYYFAQQPDGRPNPGHNKIDAIWELVVWFDLNNDTVIDAYNSSNGYYYETSRLNYDYRVGPVYHLELGDPQAAILRAAEAVANYTGLNLTTILASAHLALELRVFSNEWFNMSVNPMPLTGAADIYNASDCGMLKEPSSVSSSTSTAEFNVTISVPPNAMPGIYEAYLVVNVSGTLIHVPVSIPVAKVVNPWQRHIWVITGEPQGYLYDNYAFRPALDQSWRPEVGDWRVYPLAIPASAAAISSSVQVVVEWGDTAADYDAGLIGPGVNYWGVLDTHYATYIDAAVLGAKLTIPYEVGVYGYFDYPLPGIASFMAPLDPARPLVTGKPYAYYWLVVHQKFSDKEGEAPFIVLGFGRFIFPNQYTVSAGAKGVKVNTYIAPYYSPALLLDYAVIPLTGSGGLKVKPAIFGVGRAHIYRLTYDATQASAGLYLVEMLVYEPNSYSVIVGYTSPDEGFPAGVYASPQVPLIYVAIAYFNVVGQAPE